MRAIERWLWRLARRPPAGPLVGAVLAHMSFAIPVRRLRETDALMAFHHPRPAYPVHILLVPKRPLAGLLALTATDTDFLIDLVQTVQSLVAEFDLEHAGYRLIVNGGAAQDVPHLHFHLVAAGTDDDSPRNG